MTKVYSGAHAPHSENEIWIPAPMRRVVSQASVNPAHPAPYSCSRQPRPSCPASPGCILNSLHLIPQTGIDSCKSQRRPRESRLLLVPKSKYRMQINSSNCLPVWMHSGTGCICLTELWCLSLSLESLHWSYLYHAVPDFDPSFHWQVLFTTEKISGWQIDVELERKIESEINCQ